jgi:hypothetical protein
MGNLRDLEERRKTVEMAGELIKTLKNKENLI